MNPSKLSLFFTLSLIFISQAYGASLFEGLCAATVEDSARCLQVLKADPEIASAKNDLQLCKLILKFGLKKATEAQNYLKDLAKTNPAPAIQECATIHYDGVVGSFKSALGELVDDSMTSNYDAKVAGDGPNTCNTALAKANINDPTITALNKEISLISTIAFLATNKLP
ncbi:plant invertase/pectin methylesterase inhibitor protein [Trifolium pratense]|uniref:Uncharacterized protein n=2 Tax=Trifolium pratense TaxID=57577 RepID=A0ACB0LGH0_TRIPR|nr:uncharacterized protein LOC123909122 [Trifolium pratense]PNX94712.1 plant invertase/pectin methylesterase inhibitor protein [Trifolium pratense]CAJ2666332.1 unnamed protein product [Trifolium pratense]